MARISTARQSRNKRAIAIGIAIEIGFQCFFAPIENKSPIAIATPIAIAIAIATNLILKSLLKRKGFADWEYGTLLPAKPDPWKSAKIRG